MDSLERAEDKNSGEIKSSLLEKTEKKLLAK